MVTAVILAAGQSKRMKGEDKLFLKINSKPMYEYAINLANEIDVNSVVVVTNNPKISLRASQFGFCVVKSPNAKNGMGNSVSEGAKAVKSDYAVFLNADQPFINPETVNELIRHCVKTDKIVVPLSGGVPTSPCVFPKRYFKSLAALRGEEGGRTIWRKHLKDVAFHEVDSEQMLDIDTKEQYEGVK